MTTNDALALLPFILVDATAIVVMLSIAVVRNHRAVVGLTLLGLALAFAALWGALPLTVQPRVITELLVVDRFALLVTGLLIVAAFVVTLISYPYLEHLSTRREEYYILLLVATAGGIVLVISDHFATFFLGLELLSVSIFTLSAYQRSSRFSIEAGLKYLVLAGVSTAFLLFGMALVYLRFGTMSFSALAAVAFSFTGGALTLAGMGMILVGVGYKLALVPFHQWTPDVYEGAPAPVTAFIASVSKGAVFALLLRFFVLQGEQLAGPIYVIFAVLAIASMFIGNLLGLQQRNLKRLLAYSSIANMGYLLVAFLASGPRAATAVTFYLVAYLLTVLAAFAVIAALSTGAREADQVEDYQGLAWRRPWLATALIASLLSLAGLPLTVGFIGKFYLFVAGVSAGQWLLVVSLALASAIGLYYYLRVVIALFHQPEAAPAPFTARTPVLAGAALVLLTVAVLWLGIYPTPLLRLIDAAISRGF